MKNKNILILSAWIIISFWACNTTKIIATKTKTSTVVFEETAGISRNLEYVKASFANYHDKILFLKNISDGTIIRGEKMNKENSSKNSSTYIFPISIQANEKKSFSITNLSPELEPSTLKFTGENVSVKIENENFVADFNTNEKKIEKGLYPGQLAGIFIKNKNTLLQRGHINMHWAPNFQKEGLDYKTIGHIHSTNAKVTQKNAYAFEMTKSGNVTGYEEIDLFGQYNFYAKLPYFIYTSTMTFNKDIELLLLRNDEMTLDSLFTHLVYPDSSGKATQMPMYDMKKFDSLTKSPLADDIKWVGFINKSHGYGLVSMRLEYDNQNIDGEKSPLYQQHTKISASHGNGRYWNRRLIHEHNTLVPKGSRYYERNAYLVIDNLDKIDSQINYYIKSLKNPISVSYALE